MLAWFTTQDPSSEHALALHRTDSSAPARSVRGRRDYAYESTKPSLARSDLDHAVGDCLEFLVFRGDTTTLRYGQRSKWCDNGECHGNVDDIRCFRSDRIIYGSRDFSS